MAVKLSKEESIAKINLRKDTLVSLVKNNEILNNLTSRVAIVLDYSYSMNKLYKNGSIQMLLEKLIPLALKFDDNGALDFWIFEDDYHRIGEVTMDNFYNFVEREVTSKYDMHGTMYSPVMTDVYRKYVLEEPITYPSYVMFITDGDCDDRGKALQCIRDYSKYNIFWQFIGIGRSSFTTLERLDDLEDRFIDNADFFSVDSIVDMEEKELYARLMNEYPGYIKEAVNKGIIALKNNKVEKEKKVMAVSLAKGGKVSLAKVASDAGIATLSKIRVGLGWDCNKYDGGADFDLDASAFLCGENGKVPSDSDFVFYNNKERDGITHMGDNRTGEGEGDDETILIDLNAVAANINEINFTVTIDQADVRKQNFGMVENSYIRLVDEASGTELVRYDLGEDFSVESAIVVAKLYRHNGEWKFAAIGSGFAGGLAALCKNFGVNI